ncbi:MULTISPECIES: SDR family NAD(P)-dependent oxidoreductase [unclassified Meiothermus]|uniref:SDR family NAD(P)-dependent oxidoreductase n=1 Tax=unclassified Meiothermus TaxID=370471 RepID=UPI000D7CF3D6|nr:MULTISPECIES: SDR family NAD(P)-dependent oxidoreductase [unclassified Meiothermus]PZA06783.1 daunorubicin C-13 ketoreductase [Meiothermus sp. Pnk-1]RYM33659.1 SDR family NAD(P)-dependent oxidoreductase [Meiothermus sp. PNK-Is4]
MGQRILITGSADGLGRLLAQKLVALGHRVVLHARNPRRAEEALAQVPGAEGVLVGDLARPEEVLRLAEAAKAAGPFHAVVHNAGVYQAPEGEILWVNTLAPYLLTALIPRPQRLVYVSSDLHLQARPDLEALAKGQIGYGESKFYLVLLAKALARLWPEVYANAVDPGWVPTRMGGPTAPGSLEAGVATQAWLAVSDDPRAKVSGRYFHHLRAARPHPQTDNVVLQEAFLTLCAKLTGVALPKER